MRVPKLLLTVCAAIVCTGLISIHAADTPAQAAARAALEQKMQELNAQSSQTNAAPSAPQKEAPPAQPAPSTAAIQTPPPAATADSTSSAETNTEAQVAAQAALEEKMRQLNTESEGQKQGAPILVNSSGAIVVETPTNQPAPAMAAPAAMTPPSSGSGLFEPATPTPPNTGDQAAAQEALQQKMATLNQGQEAAQPATPETRPAFSSSSPAASSASYAAKEPGFQPIVAPPLPISTDKEAQLQALTAKYMANEISPEAYFKQREEILSKQ
jgi:hypothetical protein